MTWIGVSITMVVAGIMGALVNVALGALQGDARRDWGWNIVAGLGASFLTPLFLRTVSSGLLTDILGQTPKPEDVFVFGGFSLLAAIASRTFIQTLSDKVLGELAETRATANKADVGNLKSQAYAAAVWASGPGRTFSERDNALQLLRAAREALGEPGQTDRQIVLSMGRLERLQGHYDAAIKLLTEFIAEKEKRKELDVDLGDAYYNRACYHLLKGEKEQAYQDLEKAIQLNAANKRDARQDDDFASIREEAKFKGLVGAEP